MKALLELQTHDPSSHDELVHAVQRDRMELARAVHELQATAAENLTLGPRVAEDCWKWIAVAAAAGLWLGTRSARRAM